MSAPAPIGPADGPAGPAGLAPVLYVLTRFPQPAPSAAGGPPAARDHRAPAAHAPGRWLGRRWRAAGAARIETPADGARPGSLLCAPRLVPGRGLELLVTAFGLLADDRPDLDLEFVGSGPAEDALRALVGELGLEDRVRFRGPLAFPDVQAALRRSTALVLPRRIDESSDEPPTVLLEALLCGTAVVTTDVLSLPALARYGETALLVAPHDAAGLAVAVLAVVDEPATASARSTATPEFSARS